MEKVWRLKNPSIEENKIVDQILKRREISEHEISPAGDLKLVDSLDPGLFEGMMSAVEKLLKAASENSRVLVYGDYDVDGITSSALLIEYFRERLQLDVSYYLPDRFEDGYGINRETLKKLGPENYDLLVAVDCGISAVSEVEYLREFDIDTLIIDHHRPSEKLPEASAIISPFFTDKDEELNLAGVGLAFKLCQALEQSLKDEQVNEYLESKLDLVALGTIADLVPLRSENRLLAGLGLEMIARGGRPGLEIIKEKVGLDREEEISAGQIGFILAPPFNAAGRLEKPDPALELLLIRDREEAKSLADDLIKLNSRRQNIQEKIRNEAENKIAESSAPTLKMAVMASESWHRGVVGIVASQLVDKYDIPIILIALDEKTGMGRGSGRSISGLNLYEALQSCSKNIEEFGGHKQAAGLTISEDRIDSFSQEFTRYIKEELSEQDYIPAQNFDGFLQPADLNRKIHGDIQKLKPFGWGNPEPLFAMETSLREMRKVGQNGGHLKIKTGDGISGIGFQLGKRYSELKRYNCSKNKFKLICKPFLNSWRGSENLEIKIKDIIVQERSHLRPIKYEDEDILLFDARGGNKKDYLEVISGWEGRSAVNIYNRRIKEKLKHKFGDLLFISSPDQLDDSCSRIVYWDPPFSLEEMVSSVRYLRSGEDRAGVHFIFSRAQLDQNSSIIDSKIPHKEFLRDIWLNYLRENGETVDRSEIFAGKDISDDLKKEILEIFSELEALEFENDKILIKSPSKNLNFHESVRYNEITRIRERFAELEKMLKRTDLSSFIAKFEDRLNKPEEERAK
ncbi:single-stranded-DNA-specific exonuclease RecJ [Halarsenatibacter silvermanii]|uniref:Single-stranded-DNA-specific exonuclease RecJ n=1 Tax=Halarsenatibacter silvermanii TaxID=321763 RepID=A0A1G9JRN7_9FIRM|nr:single-stranded-DNA-specific exonuclease RecJ [Halarsenatibacter silvermanii]SDL40032.1 single-stranded-DNA-specific exonuclease [Halarsenatibacter silvermanii]